MIDKLGQIIIFFLKPFILLAVKLTPKFIRVKIKKRYIDPMLKRQAAVILKKNGYCPVHKVQYERNYAYTYCRQCKIDEEKNAIERRDKEVKNAIKVLNEL